MGCRTIAVVIAAGASLAGCISPGERRALDEERCRSYGFRGGDAFAQCLLELDLDRAADRRSRFEGFHYGVGFGHGYGFRRW